MSATNQLTQSIIRFLNYNGFKAWRQNNGAVYSKKRDAFMKNPTHKLGIPDIIGFRKSDGKFLAIEVKTGRDKLSIFQTMFLEDVNTAGGIAFEVRDSYEDFENKFNSLTK